MPNTSTNNLLLLAARVLLSAMFILSGYPKLLDPAGTAGMIAGAGFPAATALAYLAGVFELIVGLFVLVGFQTRISAILLAWVLAVLIRLATGSATVATITASSLMLGLVEGMSTGEVSLIVLAVGAGSLFFSHVNDAGFWLVKEYFGMSVGQTIKSWSIMETVLSVTGLILVLILGLVI